MDAITLLVAASVLALVGVWGYDRTQRLERSWRRFKDSPLMRLWDERNKSQWQK